MKIEWFILGDNMSFRKNVILRRVVTWASAVLLLAVGVFTYQNVVMADNTYFALSPANSFSQNWSNPNLIASNNDWSGVPSINGYADNLNPFGTGVDPQTVLAPQTTLDVNEDAASPTADTGGIAEFEALGVVAIQGDNVADAPYLDIRLNTTGCTAPSRAINISYNLRDLDDSIDNAQMQVALQYRVGNSGNYTNIPAGYVSDATTGPNQATLVTPVFASLPVAAQNQPQVHVRIITTNAVGDDEFVGVDDISITCSLTTAAGVNLGGRVVDANGRGIRSAVMTLTGSSLAQPITVRTSSFGYYRFEGVTVGETYVVSVAAKRYSFSPSNKVVSLLDEATDTDFVADPLD